MDISLKDRVKLVKPNKFNFNEKGTVVKLYTKKGATNTTVGVLWDSNWPDGVNTTKFKTEPGHIFYYKDTDLKVVDTWNID